MTPDPAIPPPLPNLARPVAGGPGTSEWEGDRVAALREDYQAIGHPLTAWSVTEHILKHPARIAHAMHHGQAGRLIGLQVAIAVVCLVAYGVTVGTFALGEQLWMAPAKIVLGVFLSALICLPSLYVFSCLAGADSDPGRVVGALSGLVTVAALLLLAFAPVAWIFAQSTQSIVFMGILHLVFWGIALSYGLKFLGDSVRLLSGSGGGHLALWGLIFIVVTLQMTTTLRPILGRSERLLDPEKRFFFTHWGNQFAPETNTGKGR